MTFDNQVQTLSKNMKLKDHIQRGTKILPQHKADWIFLGAAIVLSCILVDALIVGLMKIFL